MRKKQAGAIAVMAVALTLCAGVVVADPHLESGAGEPVLTPPPEPAAGGGSGLRLSADHGALGDRSSALRLPPPRVTLSGVDPYLPSTGRPVNYADTRVAQFQLPQPAPRPGVGPSKQAAREIAPELPFQYAFGSDSEFTYSRNPDLNHAVRDNLSFAAPTAFLLATVRPTAWIDLNFEITFEQQLRIHEQNLTNLPNGDVLPAERRRASLLIDQANIVLKNFPEPFEVTFGRRNYEDPRLFLYDSAMDGLHIGFKVESFHTEISWSRESMWDGDLLRQTPKTSVKNYIWYTEYRGIEDHKLAAYGIARLDRLLLEGRPQFFGLRAFGRPSDELNYWTEAGVVQGIDEVSQKYRGRLFDYGATYRFPTVPMAPCFSFGVAYGSGDSDDTDNINRQSRQTGLQSNETRFCGVTQFKRYGEFADVELSNIRIHTLGFGFRPFAGVFVDIVAHRYTLSHFANEFRSSGITAEMNNSGSPLSKRVGKELDLILGFRNLFNSRLAFEARAGVFFPGDAYIRNDGTGANPRFVKPDKGISVLAVIIY